MQVGLDGSAEVRHPAQLQLLADLGGQVGDRLLDGPAVLDLGGQQSVDLADLPGRGRTDDGVGESLELGVLGDEVGLRIQLDKRTVTRDDEAFGGGALGALANVLGALDAQHLDGLVEVTVRLGQGVLAVEHSGTGQFPEPLHIGGSEIRHLAFLGCGFGGRSGRR